MYRRDFGKGFTKFELIDHYTRIKEEISSKSGEEVGYYDYFKFRLAYSAECEKDLFILFVSDLTDDFFSLLQKELYTLKENFLNFCDETSNELKFDLSNFEALDSQLDQMARTIKPKISLVGYGGVGKTTIKNLIMMDKIPLEHIPTITANIATIKIGKLYFFLWDFAGQEQFEFIWKKLIQGSDAVLIVTDSTPENVKASEFFIDLSKKETPNASIAIVGNKQDLPDAMDVKDIEKVLNMETYPMIANRPENRAKMIQIISEILHIVPETSALLEPIVEKERLIKEAEITLKNGLYEKTAELYDRIIELCYNELGDEELGKQYSEKVEKLRNYLKGLKALQDGI